jgi:hypothetical protein
MNRKKRRLFITQKRGVEFGECLLQVSIGYQ